MSKWKSDGQPDWTRDDVSTDVESVASSRGSKDGILKSPLTKSEHDQNDRKSTKSPNGFCSKVATYISLMFFICFVVLSVYFDNDESLKDKQWLVFLSYQATVAFLSMAFRSCSRWCGFFISLIASFGLIWSIALVIVTGMNYHEDKHIDQNSVLNQTNVTLEDTLDEMYDNFASSLQHELGLPGETEQDQASYELACSLLGVICSMYHVMLWCCKCYK